MKSIVLATAFLVASFSAALAMNDAPPMHDMHHHHHGCVTVKKVIHAHGHTITKVEKSCH